MNLCFLVVLYHTSSEDIKRLTEEIVSLGFNKDHIFLHDNTKKNIGFAGGGNILIKKAYALNFDSFILANPDISMKGLTKKDIDFVSRRFDIYGFAFKQDNYIYYGGELDSVRMSGGLIKKKPSRQYVECEFISGSFMGINRSVIDKIGDLKEDYFLYYEDVEYCVRAKKAGFRVGIDTFHLYEHIEQSKNNSKKKTYLLINHLRFLWEYGSFSQKLYEVLRFPKTIYEYFC